MSYIYNLKKKKMIQKWKYTNGIKYTETIVGWTVT